MPPHNCHTTPCKVNITTFYHQLIKSMLQYINIAENEKLFISSVSKQTNKHKQTQTNRRRYKNAVSSNSAIVISEPSLLPLTPGI